MTSLKKISKLSIYSIYKSYQFSRIKKKGIRIIEEYFNSHSIRKIHIGAGGSIIADWLNLDIEPLDEKIAYFDAASIFPFQDDSIDYIYSEHLFEHLNLDSQLNMLQESFRVLKPEGKIRIATPNLNNILDIKKNEDEITQKYISWTAQTFFPKYLNNLGESVKNEIFVINNYFYSWGHKFIHNPYTIQLLLNHVKFSRIGQYKVYESEDDDLKNLETHGTVIPAEFNEMETMVFEATKPLD